MFGQAEGNQLDLDQIADRLPVDLLKYALVALVALVVLYVVWKILSRQRGRLPQREPKLVIDVDTLGAAGPPPAGPRLEHYHVPVRLAAVVLAPAGRAGRLPPRERMGQAFEAIVPGLAEVARTHSSLVRLWPEQLSTSGFAHAFFRHVKLPGDAGKGTCWCSAAGTAKLQGKSIMVGMVMRTDSPNSFGQIVVERETQWLDILRIRRGE